MKIMSGPKRIVSRWAKHARSDGSFNAESLTPAAKEELFRECEAIGSGETGKPLSAAQRRLHARARRRKG